MFHDYTLRDLIKIKNGKNYQDLSSDGTTPVYGTGGLMGYTSSKGLFNGKALLLPRKGSLTNIMYVNEEFWTVDTMYYAPVISPSADTYYLYNYLKLLDLSRLDTGSGVPSMTFDSYYDIKLKLPDIQTQQNIAKIIQLLNDKVFVNNTINTELERIARLNYDYWFTQFDFPDENGMPYKSSGGAMVYNEQLKKDIPFNWVVKKVSDLLPVVTGKKDANHATEHGLYNFFTCGEEILKCDTYQFEGKAILVAGNGNFNVKLYEGKFDAYQRTYVLIPEDERHYTLVYLAVKDRIQSLANGSRGSIVKFITKGDLEDILIAIPKDTDFDFYSSLNKITKSIEKNLEENQKLLEIRDWILPMLVTGQISAAQ